jgi:hypothetical protein
MCLTRRCIYMVLFIFLIFLEKTWFACQKSCPFTFSAWCSELQCSCQIALMWEKDSVTSQNGIIFFSVCFFLYPIQWNKKVCISKRGVQHFDWRLPFLKTKTRKPKPIRKKCGWLWEHSPKVFLLKTNPKNLKIKIHIQCCLISPRTFFLLLF